MEPLNDRELDQLLRQWQAPAAPRTLGAPFGHNASWWQWLWSAKLQVPVPVGFAVLVAGAGLWAYMGSQPTPQIQPKANVPARPRISPVESSTPAAPAAAWNPAPKNEQGPRPEQRSVSPGEVPSLAGFQPVNQVKTRIVVQR